jgi:hypothetical protein
MCSADARIHASERLARCYAADRPRVHVPICQRLFSAPPAGFTAGGALDVGWGAGASEGHAWDACRNIFDPLFAGEPRPVIFDAVLAVARAAGERAH